MSANLINISIDARAAADVLVDTRGALGALGEVHRVAAAAVGKQVRAWFIARNRLKSKHTRSNYWSQAAEAITTEADAASGRIIIRHPGAYWHRYGGTISAKPGKALAIPLRDEVYGVWPSEFFKSRSDAFVWRSPKGQAFLVASEGRKAGKKTLRIFYLLLKSVTKGPDETVLPPTSVIHAAASDAMRQIIRTAMRRRAARSA